MTFVVAYSFGAARSNRKCRRKGRLFRPICVGRDSAMHAHFIPLSIRLAGHDAQRTRPSKRTRAWVQVRSRRRRVKRARRGNAFDAIYKQRNHQGGPRQVEKYLTAAVHNHFDINNKFFPRSAALTFKISVPILSGLSEPASPDIVSIMRRWQAPMPSQSLPAFALLFRLRRPWVDCIGFPASCGEPSCCAMRPCRTRLHLVQSNVALSTARWLFDRTRVRTRPYGVVVPIF